MLEAVRAGEHPHHPRGPILPKGVVISQEHMAQILKFLLDMNFTAARKDLISGRVFSGLF
jgi:hypothetical protein